MTQSNEQKPVGIVGWESIENLSKEGIYNGRYLDEETGYYDPVLIFVGDGYTVINFYNDFTITDPDERKTQFLNETPIYNTADGEERKLKIGDKVEYLGGIYEVKEFHSNGRVTEFTNGLQAHTDHLMAIELKDELDEYWNWKHCDNKNDIISDKKYKLLPKDQQKYYVRWATNKAVGERISEINSPQPESEGGLIVEQTVPALQNYVTSLQCELQSLKQSNGKLVGALENSLYALKHIKAFDVHSIRKTSHVILFDAIKYVTEALSLEPKQSKQVNTDI